jgi:hypothetical protein
MFCATYDYELWGNRPLDFLCFDFLVFYYDREFSYFCEKYSDDWETRGCSPTGKGVKEKLESSSTQQEHILGILMIKVYFHPLYF